MESIESQFIDAPKKPGHALNKFKRSVGRPLRFSEPADLQAAINEYLENTDFVDLTITGLALSMGTNRQSLLDYEARDGYGEIVKQAKCIIEHSYEVALRRNGRAGEIFALKNFGWKDRTPDMTMDDMPPPKNVIVEIVDARRDDE